MALLADVSRVWSNCRTYNHPAHPVNAACDTVEKYFRDTWSKNGLAQYGRPTVLGPYYDPHAPDDEDFGEGAAEREEGAGLESAEPPVNIEDLPEGTSLTAFIQ